MRAQTNTVPSVAMAAYEVDDDDDERPKNDDRYEEAPLDSAPASFDIVDREEEDEEEAAAAEADDVRSEGSAATPPQRSHAITPRSLRRMKRAAHAQNSHGAEVPRSDVSPAEGDGASEEEAVLPMIHSVVVFTAQSQWAVACRSMRPDLNVRVR